ncbi:uncharacterized protein LOC124131148 [Haliotis rufescens]|uniref:uncharacterized protein LOC124131148 n=1 Tax=Haliotis rufescens TaxID=6454 RepID=UPI001EB08341|nr:uncharacterized protein LOC124131148 [Haliotis rufescens]
MFNCTETDVWGNPYTFQCTYGCCGSSSFRYCCSSNGNSYIPTPWQPDIPDSVIAGVTAGCVLGLVVIVGVVYALCKHAKKRDRFMDEAINRLRIPQGKATRQVNVTTRMYPGPRSGVKLLTTYIPRESPQLASTPVGDAPASLKPQKQLKSKRKGTKSTGNIKPQTHKTQNRIAKTTTSGTNRKSHAEATPGQPGDEKAKGKARGTTDGKRNVKMPNTKDTKLTTNLKRSPTLKRKNKISQ